MIHSYVKLNDDDNTATQDTRFIYRFCFRHMLIVCHWPDSVITKLHIFLSLSHFFLLVAGWWISDSYWHSLWPCGSQNICIHCRKCRVFMTSKNLGCLASWTEFCETLGQNFLKKTHKTESVLGKWDRMWYLRKKESAVCSCLVSKQNRPRDKPVVVVIKYNITPQYFT